ncbi:hypothetical protein ABZ656_48810, partial [Streptomyces sp. NPDC007095]|uniref:hypothetical protein n=1 Tax=Streptomyces sp. NPDC007095 TaxID=3154482 RepID=UPI0033DA5B83
MGGLRAAGGEVVDHVLVGARQGNLGGASAPRPCGLHRRQRDLAAGRSEGLGIGSGLRRLRSQALRLGVDILDLLGGCRVRSGALVLLGLEVLGLRDTCVGPLGQPLRFDLDGDVVGLLRLGDRRGGGVGRVLGGLGVRRRLLGRGGRLPGMGGRVIGVLGGVVRMRGCVVGRVPRVVRRTSRFSGQFRGRVRGAVGLVCVAAGRGCLGAGLAGVDTGLGGVVVGLIGRIGRGVGVRAGIGGGLGRVARLGRRIARLCGRIRRQPRSLGRRAGVLGRLAQRSAMDTSDDVLMLGDVLLGMWSARDRLLKAG